MAQLTSRRETAKWRIATTESNSAVLRWFFHVKSSKAGPVQGIALSRRPGAATFRAAHVV
jgi:hypothetical protein